MKHFKTKVLLTITALFGIVGCNNGGSNSDNFVIEKKDEIGIREYFEIKAYYNEKECSASYTSSNKKVATVSSTGLVKGLSIGETTITATLSSDTSITTSFSLRVRDSMEPSIVLRRFVDATSYHTTAKGEMTINSQKYNLDFEEKFYSDSYEFIPSTSGKNKVYVDSYGLGQDINNAYMYKKNSGEVISAQYFRKGISDYHIMISDINDFYLNSLANVGLNDENTYEINDSGFAGTSTLMFIQNMQNEDVMNVIFSSLQSVSLQILTPYEFRINYGFSGTFDGNFSLTFSDIGNDTNEALVTYLKSNKVVVPEVYDDIKKVQELAKNHNFSSDLGNYRKQDGTTFSMGKCYYTEDYCFIDYSDEYVKETEGTYSYVDNGYINIANKQNYEDGVYEFTASKEGNGNIKYEIGDRVTEAGYTGLPYMKYYDFVENLSLIMSQMEPVLYSFEETSTQDYGDDYNEYASWTTFGTYITRDIFADLIDSGLVSSAMGLIISIKYDSSNPKNTKVNYGGLFQAITGDMTYMYSDFEYTGFGDAKVDTLDQFLKSLPDKSN